MHGDEGTGVLLCNIKSLYFAISAVFLLEACGGPNCNPCWDAGVASTKLRIGMTEEEAISAIGWDPSASEMSTCGGAVGQPFSCKADTFGWPGDTLYVLLGQDDGNFGIWRVGRWMVIQ